MGEARRVTTIAASVLLVWAVLLGLWAIQPLTDQVPTGEVDGAATSVSVECGRPIDAEPGPDQPLPDLEPPQKYQREACVAQHSDNRWMLIANVVLMAAIAVGLIIVRLRVGRSDPTVVEGQPPSGTAP